MGETSIEWTDTTWNPVRGCALVSPGCQNCYAMKFAHRFSAPGKPYEGLTEIGKHGPRWTGSARFVPEMLRVPLSWRKPRRVFVNSMSDLFHEDVTDEQIGQIFAVMANCPRHTFQILTKRPERMRQWFATPVPMNVRGSAFRLGLEDRAWRWPLPNVWIGVSVEDQLRADERVPLLLDTPAAVRFVSYEPALGPIYAWGDDTPEGFFSWLDGYVHTAMGKVGPCDDDGNEMPHLLRRIDWVIVGGESGHGARGFLPSWARATIRQCRDAGTACFVKQLGTECPGLKDRKGGDPSEWPEDLRVRQFPELRHA